MSRARCSFAVMRYVSRLRRSVEPAFATFVFFVFFVVESSVISVFSVAG